MELCRYRPSVAGTSLLEIMIAMSLLMLCLLPVLNMFSSSGRAVQKSQNLGFAVALAHRIGQQMMTLPYTKILSVAPPGNPIYGGPDDLFFNPVENWGTSAGSQLRITPAQMPDLYGFLRKFGFQYYLEVNQVTFGTGDSMKNVGIFITWKEGGQDLLYRTHVFIPSI